jgi:hypothetical protein
MSSYRVGLEVKGPSYCRALLTKELYTKDKRALHKSPTQKTKEPYRVLYNLHLYAIW